MAVGYSSCHATERKHRGLPPWISVGRSPTVHKGTDTVDIGGAVAQCDWSEGSPRTIISKSTIR
jgi:hypothetical protein